MNTAMVTNAGRAISQVPTTEALGKHIYIYNNIRTNQVVYSLSRTLQVYPLHPLPACSI